VEPASHLEQLGISGPAIGPLRISVVCRKHEEYMEPRKNVLLRRRRGAKGGDGDAAATVAHAAKEGDDEEEEDVDAAAALPRAVAPVRAPSAAAAGRFGEW